MTQPDEEGSPDPADIGRRCDCHYGDGLCWYCWKSIELTQAKQESGMGSRWREWVRDLLIMSFLTALFAFTATLAYLYATR